MECKQNAYQKMTEVRAMCNNNCGNNWWWIIILLLIFCNCGCGNTGGSWGGNNCGCDNNCGCC